MDHELNNMCLSEMDQFQQDSCSFITIARKAFGVNFCKLKLKSNVRPDIQKPETVIEYVAIIYMS